jgi:hypothetical protein
MTTYMEYVEAAQFKKGNAALMECLDLACRGGHQYDWVLTSDSLKIGGDGYDSFKFYVKPGDWLVLRSDSTLQIVEDKDFGGRYQAVPQAVEKAVAR